MYDKTLSSSRAILGIHFSHLLNVPEGTKTLYKKVNKDLSSKTRPIRLKKPIAICINHKVGDVELIWLVLRVVEVCVCRRHVRVWY